MGHGPIGYHDWGWGIAGMLPPLLLWGGVLLVAVLALRGGLLRKGGALAPTPPPAARPEDRALAILRERYARGEIDGADYDERRRGLLDDPPQL